MLSLCSPMLLLHPSPAGAGNPSHGVFPSSEVAHHHYCGKVTQGQGVPDHQVLPIGGAKHVQAFCRFFFNAFWFVQCANPNRM